MPSCCRGWSRASDINAAPSQRSRRPGLALAAAGVRIAWVLARGPPEAGVEPTSCRERLEPKNGGTRGTAPGVEGVAAATSTAGALGLIGVAAGWDGLTDQGKAEPKLVCEAGSGGVSRRLFCVCEEVVVCLGNAAPAVAIVRLRKRARRAALVRPLVR